jgi:RND family efflux transporter MFP subunit
MRFFRQSLIGLFLAALTLGLLALAAGSVLGALRERSADRPGGPPAEEVVASVRVVSVMPRTITPQITAYGELRARRSLELRAPRPGRIVWVAPHFGEGVRVVAGAPLVRLDKSEAEAALALARTDLAALDGARSRAASGRALAQDALAAAEAEVALRQAALDRQRDLLSRGAGSASAVESAELAEASARQGVLSSRQALLQVERDLDEVETTLARQAITLAEARRAVAETEITAPFGGVLNAVSLVEGGMVSANERLAILIDPDRLDVWIRVSSSAFARLADASGRLRPAAMSVRLGDGPDDLRATGRITQAGAAVEAGQAGRLIIAALESGTGLQPGDFVSVRLDEAPIADATLIPSRAVGPDGAVLALAADDRLEAFAVTILRRQGNDVIVDARLLAGREIVSDRTQQVGSGIKVRPLRSASDAGRVALDKAERARLIRLVEADPSLSDADRMAYVAQLSAPDVPADLVARITSRAGG